MKNKSIIITITLLLILLNTYVSFASVNMDDLKMNFKESDDTGWSKSVSDGIVKYTKDWKYGFKNYKGEVIIPAQYSNATDFYSGVAFVRKVDEEPLFKYMEISSKRELYPTINHFYGDMAIDTSGDVLFSAEELYDEVIKQFKYNINKMNKEIYEGIDNKENFYKSIDPPNIVIELSNFSEGLCLVYVNAFSIEPTIGYIDKTGHFVVPLGVYHDGGSFHDNQAMVKTYDNKQILIDKNGREISNKKKTNQQYLTYRKVRFYQEGLVGLKDLEGKVIIPPIYEMLAPVNELLYGVRSDNKYGVIDANGDVLIEPVFNSIKKYDDLFVLDDAYYDYVFNKDAEVIAQYKKGSYYLAGSIVSTYDSMDKKNIYMDLEGNILKDVSFSSYLGENIYSVKIGEEWALIDTTSLVKNYAKDSSINIYKNYLYKFINRDGEVVLESDAYDLMSPVYGGVSIVEKNNKKSIINMEGELIYPLIFRDIKEYPLFKDGLYFLIDEEYQEENNLLNKLDESVNPHYNGDRFIADSSGRIVANNSDGLFSLNESPIPHSIDYPGSEIFYEHGQYGIRTISENQILVKAAYDEIIMAGKGIYVLKKGRQQGFYNLKSNSLIEPSYQSIALFVTYNSLVYETEEGLEGLMDFDGQIITEAVYSEISPVYLYQIDLDYNRHLLHFRRPEGEAGLITEKGLVIIDDSESIVQIRRCDDKLIIRKVDDEENESWDIYDKENEEMIYSDLPYEPYLNPHYGIIYKNDDDKLVSLEGKILFDKPNVLSIASENYIITISNDWNYNLYDYKGKLFLENNNYKDLSFIGETDKLFYERKDGFGIVMPDGQIIVDEDCDRCSISDDGIIMYQDDGKKYFMNSDGKIIYNNPNNVYMNQFENGYGLVVEELN